MQGKTVLEGDEYKYWGVVLTNSKTYLDKFEQNLLKKAQLFRNILRAKSLWTFSKYRVTREIWKMVGIPKITYANAVLCVGVRTLQRLNVIQREVGRMALGLYDNAPNAFIEGEMAWSSFEARETQ